MRRASSAPGTSSSATPVNAPDNASRPTRPVTLPVDELERLRLPCVLHWRFDHFVVLQHVGRNTVRLFDPADGTARVGREA
ncbi:MAG: cysteine peptidase family C39 domain-containing protein, partial [Pseudomonadota bacterium]